MAGADSGARRVTRWVLALFYLTAGVLHLALPRPFLSITPHWVPWASTVIALTGVAEIAGALGLAQGASPALRRAAGVGLAFYAVCVFPANINHMLIDWPKPGHGAGAAYHVPRMFAQPVLVWAALWCGRVIDWPWRR